jgi:lysophospholipase L1-like esterase
MKKRMLFRLFIGIFICFATFSLVAADKYYIPKNNDRIIFVGDSITGLGENVNKKGWGHLIREGLEATEPGTKSRVILLGGSGHQVSSWQGIEKRSRTKSTYLDSKKFDVKKELDQGAPVLVIMLGMNDALAPYVNDSTEALNKWEENYKKLIAALQARVKPKLTCLATVTMCTEDLNSRKNKLVDALNEKIHKIAGEKGFKVAETSKSYKDVFRSGRQYKPDFHITYDYVHPNEDGHKAIAVAMLNGIGKEKEAEFLEKKYYPEITQKASQGKSGISYELIPGTLEADKMQNFKLSYNAYNIENADKLTVKAILPKGWKALPLEIKGSKGIFKLTGSPDHLINKIVLSGNIGTQKYTQEVDIPAPWLITWGINQPRWMGGTLNAKDSQTAIDSAIEEGTNFLTTAHKGKIPTWQLYYPSFNYTGKADPGSVDFAAVSEEKPFEAGYGVRWIYSPKPRDVELQLSSKMFAGKIYLTVWLNQKKVYQDDLTGKKGKKDQVNVSLKKGWNTLVFKSNRCTWQWQNSINLVPIGSDSLDDLLFSTTNRDK